MHQIIGQWLAESRRARGWTQQEMARRMGVHRATICKWEVGTEAIPRDRLSSLGEVCGVSFAGVENLVDQRPIDGLPIPRERLPDYPCSGTLQEMLDMGSQAHDIYRRAACPAMIDQEMQRRFPRDSPLELAAAYQFLAAGASLEFWSPVQLGCPYLVVIREECSPAAHLLRHTLVIRQPDLTIVAMPQVSIMVVSQSRERRPDFLVLIVFKGQTAWLDVEIDSRFHADTANDDARRAWGLRLPRRGYSVRQVLHPAFIDFLLKDVIGSALF